MILLLATFQLRLLLPTFCVALAIGVAGYFMIWSTPIILGTGFGYFLAGPMVHYYLYELRFPNEYYFYFNAGLSKVLLGFTTLGLNGIVGATIVYNA
jgi:hypothetical protein